MSNEPQHIVVQKVGDPGVMQLQALDLGDVPAGHVRVAVTAAGVNYLDVYHRSGQYDRPVPFTPGMEGAGTVVEVGEGVTDLNIGDRVAHATVPGSYATHVDAPADKVVTLPAEIEPEQAAAVMLQGLTAHYLTEAGRPLAAGDTVLVHAGGGGVGHLLVQIAKLRGARVIATASTEEKRRFATELGADHVLDSTSLLEDAVRQAADGPVDIVYDGVGKATFDTSLGVLRTQGVMVLYGAASGMVPPMDTGRLAAGSLVLTRTTLAHFVATRADLQRRADDVLGWVADGQLKVRIDSRFALEDAPAAHAHLESRQARGKVLLDIGRA